MTKTLKLATDNPQALVQLLLDQAVNAYNDAASGDPETLAVLGGFTEALRAVLSSDEIDAFDLIVREASA